MSDAAPEHQDAYALLSKPTLELTDAEVEIIVRDLRAKRLTVLKNPKAADRPKAEAKKAATTKPDKAAREAATADLLADLGLGDI